MNMKSFWTNPTFLRVLSIVLAVVAWFYIILVQNPEIDQRFSALQVHIASQESLDKRKLVVVDPQKMKMNLTVQSDRRSVSLLDENSFYASIDVSNITQAGTYTLPINVSVNDNTVTIIDKKPYYLDVLVDDYAEVEKTVELITSGDIKTGNYMRNISVSPEKLTIKGPQSIVNLVDRVVVPVTLDGLEISTIQQIKFKLLDHDGAEINNANLEKSTDTASVTMDIAAFQPIPFAVDLINPADQSYTIKNVKIQPESIRLLIPESLKGTVQYAYLGSFEIDPNSRSMTLPVKIPEGTETIDKFTTVTVTYELE